MTASPQLTPTSYTILGLLAIRPWTSYELTKQMGRSLHYFWPRAESKLYEEPKKLAANGLARAATRSVGRRTSTVYSITPAGRRALKRWLAAPGAGPVLEFELLLKVFFSEHGSKADLIATVAAVAQWAADRNRENVQMAREYAEGRGPFPDRLAQNFLVGYCLTTYWDAIGAWAAWAAQVVETWPEDIAQAEPPWDVIRAVARRPAT